MSGRVRRLRPAEADLLREQALSYSPVGATRATTYPPGFHHFDTELEIGHGDASFTRAVERLMSWQMHADAGLRPAASSDRVAEGEVLRCRFGPLPVPCRVVWVLQEPDAVGFGYGTLPGHPEIGEEAFVVRRSAGQAGERDPVTLQVSAYSRPGRLVTRLAGPLGRWMQQLAVRRYAAVLRRD